LLGCPQEVRTARKIFGLIVEGPIEHRPRGVTIPSSDLTGEGFKQKLVLGDVELVKCAARTRRLGQMKGTEKWSFGFS